MIVESLFKNMLFATKDFLIPFSLFSKHFRLSGAELSLFLCALSGAELSLFLSGEELSLFLCAIVCNVDANTGGLFLSPPLYRHQPHSCPAALSRSP